MDYFEYLNKKIEADYQKDDSKKGLDKLSAEAEVFTNSAFDDTKAVEINGASVFIEAGSESLNNLDFDNLAKNLGEKRDNTQDEGPNNPLEYVLQEFLSLDGIKSKLDKDGDGEITGSEIKEFVTELAGKDGNSDNLTLADFEAKLKEVDVDLEGLLSEVNSQQNGVQTQSEQQSQSVSDTSVANPENATSQPAQQSTHAPTSSKVSGQSIKRHVDRKGVSLETLQTLLEQEKSKLATLQNDLKTATSDKETATKEIADKEKELNNVKIGKNENIKKAKDNETAVKKDYEKAVEKDEAVKHLKKEVSENNTAIEKNTEAVEKNKLKFEQKEKSRDEFEDSVSTLNNQLSVLKSELSDLPSLSGKEEDKNRDAVIKSQRKRLDGLISKKRREIESANKKLTTAKEELRKLEEEKKKLEEEKQKLEEKRQSLEAEIKEKSNQATQKALKLYQEARANTEKVKAEELQKAEQALKDAKKKEKDAIEKESSISSSIVVAEQNISDFEERISDAKNNPKTLYVSFGSGASSVSQVAQSATTYTTKVTEAENGGVASTGRNFSYTGSSQAIKQEAIKAGYFSEKNTYTPKRGDIAIWTKSGDPAHGHVGIVEKVYEDGSFDVIEGNSSNRVKRNHYTSQDVADMGRTKFAGFCRASEWLGEADAENAIRVAENELAKGVREIGSSNDSVDIARYKRGARNNAQWCAYFTSYCFHDGQSQLA